MRHDPHDPTCVVRTLFVCHNEFVELPDVEVQELGGGKRKFHYERFFLNVSKIIAFTEHENKVVIATEHLQLKPRLTVDAFVRTLTKVHGE